MQAENRVSMASLCRVLKPYGSFFPPNDVRYLPVPVESVNDVARVAIGHIQVAAGPHDHVGQRKCQLSAAGVANLERLGERGRGNRQDDLSVERHLDDRLLAEPDTVQILAVGFAIDDEAVEVAWRVWHGAQERPVRREDLKPRVRVLDAEVGLAGTHGDVAVHVANLVPAGGKRRPAGDDVMAGAVSAVAAAAAVSMPSRMNARIG